MSTESESPAYDEGAVTRLLRTERFGRELRFFRRTATTQGTALELAAGGAVEGTTVVADEQTSGVGRRGRGWHSERGLGIWTSIVLRPRVQSSQGQVLSLWAASAVLETLRAGGWDGGRGGIKWPNDIVAGGRKLCGVLIDSTSMGTDISYAVVGVGLNTGHLPEDFPVDIAPAATSVRMLTGEKPDRAVVLSELLLQLERSYPLVHSTAGRYALLQRVANASVLMDKRVRVIREDQALEGRVVGLNDDGSLVLSEDPTGEQKMISAADVVTVLPQEEKT